MKKLFNNIDKKIFYDYNLYCIVKGIQNTMEVTKDIFVEGNLIENDFIRVYYRGKFTREFSNEVYIVFGYGPNWINTKEQKMTWIEDYFFTEIKLEDNGDFNFCFRNDFGSWDNNDYKNYSVFIDADNFNYENISKDILGQEVEKIIETDDLTEVFEEKEIVEQIDKNECVQNNINEIKENIKSNYKNTKTEKFKRATSKKDKKSRRQKKIEKNRTRIPVIQTITDDEESLYQYFNNEKCFDIDAKIAIDTIINSERVEKKPKKKKKSKKERAKANFKRYKKNKVKKEIRIVCGIVLICCITYLIIYFIESRNVQKQTENLLNTVKIDNNVNDTNTDEIEFVETERMLQVKELNSRYPELKGWIEIKGTNINYPLMQGNDNSYYMTHDYKKEYSRWGSLFLDQSYDWTIPSSNLLVYGHNFSDGVMLSELLKYKDKSFFDEYPVINFTTPEEDAEYEIISVFYSRVYYKSEKDVFRYYYFVNALNENEYNEFVTNAKNASIYDTGKTAQYGDQLLTLSTCEYSQEDGRFVVVARKK